MDENLQSVTLRRRIVEAAFASLADDGRLDQLLARSAARAGVAAEQRQAFFSDDSQLILAMYLSIASELEAAVDDLPPGTLAARFSDFMRAKLAVLEKRRNGILALSECATSRRSELGVLHEQTELVRTKVLAALHVAVGGASDGPLGCEDALVDVLYLVHLALVYAWSRDRSSDRAGVHSKIRFFERTLSLTAKTPLLSPLASISRAITRSLVRAPDTDSGKKIARLVLSEIFRSRRLVQGTNCDAGPCELCFAPQVVRAAYFVRRGEPVHVILPGFPAKSPSPRKTLGRLPDKADEVGLRFLADLCTAVRAHYPPGLTVTICSDGHVFSDLVGITDDDVDTYSQALSGMLESIDAPAIKLFSLRNCYEGTDIGVMREHYIRDYAVPIEEIKRRAGADTATGRHVDGIHRFLFEEQRDMDDSVSKNSVKTRTRALAYHVVQRSDAWSRLLAECFPTALRLSIHPQHPHAEKIGIMLGRAEDLWLTPWHGSAVLTDDGWRLMKRQDAESLGFSTVSENGRPVYFDGRTAK